tara:strand:+ start:481 stop:897 length:417 start_codon:yes stop_codon:yes gene_type:complete
MEGSEMTYRPSKPALGYIQATGVTTSSVNNIAFDIPNDMGTSESSGKTELGADSVVKMAFSRSDDGPYGNSLSYSVRSGATDVRYQGRIPAEVTNYFQASEYAFDFGDNIEPITRVSVGSANIVFTDYSHALIWRLTT